MHTSKFLFSSRRSFLKNLPLLGLSVPLMPNCTASGKEKRESGTSGRPFRISLNVSTISGFRLPVEEQIEAVAAAGFDGIELWLSDVSRHIEAGGRVEDLARRMRDCGLTPENMIAFARWIGNDPQQSAEGMEQMKREMELTVQLGGRHIAATGAGLDVFLPENIALYGRQFAELNRIGRTIGVTPLLELWGHGILNRLWKMLAIATESGCPEACFLLDFYHLYAGGNPFGGLALLNGLRLPVFHINDYPGDIPAGTLKDSDRVYPGDGACPFGEVIPLLYHAGFRGALSLELFNESYWRDSSPARILETGYRKTAEVVDRALEGI
ncbi:MAG: sugar phosphate isomerase/epimerase [Tannerella sp.]|nr:sugar phosphate isomerase/epimerase [Tannerella sp.]